MSKGWIGMIFSWRVNDPSRSFNFETLDGLLVHKRNNSRAFA